MSRIIKITPECLEEIRRDFEEALSKTKLSDGKLSFTKNFGTVDRKAKLYFSEIAWIKMQSLIREFDKEVAWHGVATRNTDETKDEYVITDILVYPQEVTGATVNTDQIKYQTWLMQHDDDVFNNIRMQGHSHVNMGTSPSAVDTTHQERILEQLEDDMFYIFLIWNKKNDKTIKIFDLKKNILFETSDVTVEVLTDDIGVEQFIKDAKNLVVDKPAVASTTQTGGNSYYSGYYKGDYCGYYSGYGGYGNYGNYKSENNTKGAVFPVNDTKEKDQKPDNQTNSKNKKKGKGKRKDKKPNSNTYISNASDEKQASIDDYDDPYGANCYGFGWDT